MEKSTNTNSKPLEFLIKCIWVILFEALITVMVVVSLLICQKYVFWTALGEIRGVVDFFYIIFIVSNLLFLIGFISKLYIDKSVKEKENQLQQVAGASVNQHEKDVQGRIKAIQDRLMDNHTTTNSSFSQTNEKISKLNSEVSELKNNLNMQINNFTNGFNTQVSDLGIQLETLSQQLKSFNSKTGEKSSKSDLAFLELDDRLASLDRKVDERILELNNRVSESNRKLGMDMIEVNQKLTDINPDTED